MSPLSQMQTQHSGTTTDPGSGGRLVATDGRVRRHPSWADLDAAGRREAFEVARGARALEAALDPDGLSTTARAVLARIRAARP